ncbi:SDR family oxidoreductase [Halococcus salifodinae]|uniref:Oxidoreductase n=1 Tax=Halococcus salifodinae DSM 8989 TaxID=1227456 RepID=M0N5M1_9EURY|nr:SDR family oxidoreductase [Halococcus salifodinae]EMA53166.1 oxidoreductase [Halococcus salifodinae DSM 8989]
MTTKTVLITGCSSGIGRATAEAFRDEEWTVYATARDEKDLSALAQSGCETAALDITDDEAVTAVIDRIVDDTGRIDCLVNNAGYGQFGPIEDVPIGLVRDQFDANVYGPHRLTRAVLPHMRDRGTGTIVNVSSTAGRFATPAKGVYAGSKFALEAMTDALRTEIADYGIDVAVVAPGPVNTDFEDRAADELAGLERSGAYETFYDLLDDSRTVVEGGVGTVSPAEVAEAVVDAAVSPNPPARYPVGPLASLAEYARFLPAGVRNQLYSLVRRVV